MTKLPVTREVYEAIKAGFSLSEMEVYRFENTEKGMAKYLKNPAVAAHPEAFLDGVTLRERVCLIFSADTMSDYKKDIASYDATATALNRKYGNIVLTSAQVEEAGNLAYGLVGARTVPFTSITTTDFSTGTTTVETPGADIDAADAETSSQLEFADE